MNPSNIIIKANAEKLENGGYLLFVPFIDHELERRRNEITEIRVGKVMHLLFPNDEPFKYSNWFSLHTPMLEQSKDEIFKIHEFEDLSEDIKEKVYEAEKSVVADRMFESILFANDVDSSGDITPYLIDFKDKYNLY